MPNQQKMQRTLLSFALLLQISVVFAQNKATFTIQADKPGAPISPTMWGVFFEDINLGADGGMYAELIKNRSFEFFKPLMGWQLRSSKAMGSVNFGSNFLIINRPEMAATNPRYLQVKLNNTPKDSLGLTNEGFRGMGIKQGLRYDFSVLYRLQSGNAKMHLELISEKGAVIGTGVFVPKNTGDVWQKGESSFTATASDPKAKLNIWFEGNGTLDVDMLSLFPADTWKGRKGGLRADMIQMLADLKPGFIRFPGGCIVEGHDLSVRYQWKRTIGPVEDRKLLINRWNYEFAHRPTPDYFQTFGLGFFEYFQMAEDIGAEPLPILNCGMACQFNSAEVAPIEDLAPYVQDALDLIEFANGSTSTKWGKMRADMGHPAPFHLKMLGVGNENWGPQYIERLKVFQAAIKRAYPNIKLVCSSGINHSGELFDYLNKELRDMKVELIDEHYYSRPEWFLANAKRYDNYDRKSASKVFAGEYAGQTDRTVSVNNKNNWRAALAEAAYMTGLERNADVVEMASYAPLFGHTDGWQWKPNLIWVDNLKTMATPNYHVQKLYANNKGSQVIPILYKDKMPATGQDSLYASASLDKSSNELIIKIVNAGGKAQMTELAIEGVKKLDTKAKLTILRHENLEAENTMETPGVVLPVEQVLELKGKNLGMELKGYSFVVIRVQLL